MSYFLPTLTTEGDAKVGERSTVTYIYSTLPSQSSMKQGESYYLRKSVGGTFLQLISQSCNVFPRGENEKYWR